MEREIGKEKGKWGLGRGDEETKAKRKEAGGQLGWKDKAEIVEKRKTERRGGGRDF